jgi:hypothetical protein
MMYRLWDVLLWDVLPREVSSHYVSSRVAAPREELQEQITEDIFLL